ncbi:MAG: C25 family cysteine peptidase [Thermoplasmata archaeon]
MNSVNKKKLLAATLIFIIVFAAIGYYLLIPLPPKIVPTIELPPRYMVLVDEPKTESDFAFAASLSSLIVRNNTYNPFFVLENGTLDDHQLWTINNMKAKDVPKLLFTNSVDTLKNIKSKVTNVTRYPTNSDALRAFKGFSGEITVGSYKESLWASPVAHKQNKIITIGKSTYSSQEQVWSELKNSGTNANYVVVTNPKDSSVSNFNASDKKYLIKSLSLISAEIAAYHDAYVLTDIANSAQSMPSIDSKLNGAALGVWAKLKEIYTKYGHIEYIAMVGSAPAVPQFQLPDLESGAEADGLVNSDSVYGLLDNDTYTIDAAVGRIINYNVAGASNMMVRTYAYNDITDKVDVEYTYTGKETVTWKTDSSSWNGYEVADKRMQMTPGLCFKEDANDEGFTCDYMRTTGNGGWISDDAKRETNFKPIMESSGLVAYRGHGSWHASLYVWKSSEEYSRDRLEGTTVRNYFLPPQIGMFAACENAKIQGTNYGGTEIDMDALFCTNYLYGGAIGLIGATEVSYSYVGQDIYVLTSPITGNPDWDKNNAIYAFFWDGILNHEDKYGTIGKALQWAQNRYMAKHPGTTPIKDFNTDDWKQVSMYVVYGDPAFKPYQPKPPGANNYDPWHNEGENINVDAIWDNLKDTNLAHQYIDLRRLDTERAFLNQQENKY